MIFVTTVSERELCMILDLDEMVCLSMLLELTGGGYIPIHVVIFGF